MGHESDGDAFCNLHTRNDPQRLGKCPGRVGNRRNWNYPNYCIVKTDQEIEKSPGDLKWLAVTQAQVNWCEKPARGNIKDDNNNNMMESRPLNIKGDLKWKPVEKYFWHIILFCNIVY